MKLLRITSTSGQLTVSTLRRSQKAPHWDSFWILRISDSGLQFRTPILGRSLEGSRLVA